MMACTNPYKNQLNTIGKVISRALYEIHITGSRAIIA
jgi:hypothetical protein